MNLIRLLLIFSFSFIVLAIPVESNIDLRLAGAGQAGDGSNSGNGQAGDGANFIKRYGKINTENPFQLVLERLEFDLEKNVILKKMIDKSFFDSGFGAEDIFHAMSVVQIVQSLEVDMDISPSKAFKIEGNKIFVNPDTFSSIFKWKQCHDIYQDLAMLKLVIEYYGFVYEQDSYHELASTYSEYICEFGRPNSI